MTFSGFIRMACRRSSSVALVCALAGLQPAQAADLASEDAQLAVMVRQLDMVERLADQSAQLPHDGRARYHFDYARLHADVARVRAGIQDYLTPPRAQPRDPVDLLGDYRTSSSRPGGSP